MEADDEVAALVRAADELEAAARATEPTPEEERRIIDAYVYSRTL